MMGSFVSDCMVRGLGICAVVALVALFVAWLGHVINSVVRSADALERIADALDDLDRSTEIERLERRVSELEARQ